MKEMNLHKLSNGLSPLEVPRNLGNSSFNMRRTCVGHVAMLNTL